jgi:cytochrome P450/NADPH-cytochrome P450 reductase
MVGSGTCVAPFRGFLQARAVMKQKGIALGEAHLYVGCRDEADLIYREELESYERDGVVTLHTAFFHIQHVVEQQAKDFLGLLDQGGRLYVCGDGTQEVPDVEAALQRAYLSMYGAGQQEAQKWLESIQENGSYAKDVWASS